MGHTAFELIDQLIGGWNKWEQNEAYYLQELAPAIVRGDRNVHLMPYERQIIEELRSKLTADEWNRFPELLKQRRLNALEELESDRKQREAESKRRREKAEQQRLREEENRKKKEAELDRRRQEAVERKKREETLRTKKRDLVRRVRNSFESNFLAADEILLQDSDHGLLSGTEYFDLKTQFVLTWASREFDQSLDRQQSAAVAATGGDIQIVARAGAGKTRTLVARAIFLQKHCGVNPGELLLLAFNKDAASEMQKRLSKELGDNVPHVMTFHSLAYSIVHPEEDILYDDSAIGNLGLSREIQRVIDEHLQSDEYRPLIRDLMLSHFRDDWERIVDGGFHLTIEELIRFRNALPRETLKGEYVKSFGERIIANTLFQYDIEYKYERSYRWDGTNYKPDFTILLPNNCGIVIEYFGLQGDADYDKESQRKRQFWAKREGWTLFEFAPTDISSLGVERFSALLINKLEGLGVHGSRLSDEELWERIRRRAVDKFTGAVRSFVSRCRKLNLRLDKLRHIIDRHTPISEAERLFLKVSSSVYSKYIQWLSSTHQEDFDGLMWRAVALLDEGESRFSRNKGKERGDLRKVRFVLIDEFQDFSDMFYRLTLGIKSINPKVQFFCVGDDWQAINGFAGSDLRFFNEFNKYFQSTTTLHIGTNYRSPRHIVQIGNALMTGLGTPAVAHSSDNGWLRTTCLSEFVPTISERAMHGGDESTPAVLRLVKYFLDSGRDVVMLSRRNDVPWYVNYKSSLPSKSDGLERFVEHVRSFLPVEDRRRLTISTAHQYKGLEKNAVIVIDADEGIYPLIHPNWVFLRVFGDSVEKIESEERRLFYVALTRSQHSLVILSDVPHRESPFLKDIKAEMELQSLLVTDLAPVQSLDSARLEIRVSNAYKIRNTLKEIGYRWNDSIRCWCRSVVAEGFHIESIFDQPWASELGICIEVYSEGGELVRHN